MVVATAWIAIGLMLLRRGRSPIGRQPPTTPSLARRVAIAFPIFLLLLATPCLLVLKMGLPTARIGQFLLLRETELEFLQLNFGLGIVYLLFLLVIIVPSLPRRKVANTDEIQDAPLMGKSIDVSDEWKKRCDRFRTLNRRWLIVAFVLLTVAGVLTAQAFLGDMSMNEYVFFVIVLIVVAIALFPVASAWLRMRLKCPHCSRPPLRHDSKLHRWLDDIKECEWCRARLAY